MTFEECLMETAKTPELWREFCRLKGYRLPTNTIEQMVDEATGREEQMVKEYAQFVFEHIYLPVFVWPRTDQEAK